MFLFLKKICTYSKKKTSQDVMLGISNKKGKGDCMRKLIFFDIDGTLVTPKNHLPASTRKAIGMLKENGHIPVFSTGRPPGMIYPLAEELDVTDFISLNGQYIVTENQTLTANTLPNDLLEELIETSYEEGDRTFLLTEDDIIGNTFMKELFDPEFLTLVYTEMQDTSVDIQHELFLRMTEKPLEREQYEDEDILVAFINAKEEQDDFYRKAFPEFHVTRATPLLSEVLMKGSHKATAMKEVAGYYGIERKDTVAFGDSLNDLEMVETAEIGVAMGNAREDLKEVADYVTDDVEADGIYKGLKEINLI